MLLGTALILSFFAGFGMRPKNAIPFQRVPITSVAIALSEPIMTVLVPEPLAKKLHQDVSSLKLAMKHGAR